MVRSGACLVDSAGCLQSPNYPAHYGDSQTCEMSVDTTSGGYLGQVHVDAFETQSCCDHVTVNGVQYSGVVGPHGIVPTGTVTWNSDYSATTSGFRLCLVDSGLLAPPAPPPPPPSGQWIVQSGSCGIDYEGCLISPNHPYNYGNSEACTMHASPTAPIFVSHFSTESCCDVVVVNGNRYSGAAGPSGVAPTGTVSWNTDGSVQSSGWRLCLAPSSAAPAAAPQGTASDAPPPAISRTGALLLAASAALAAAV